MSAFQIVIVLVCAAMGFGIVNNLINAARSSKQVENEKRADRSPP